MNKILREKIQESLASVLPITGIVLLLCFTVSPISLSTILLFLVGAVFLIVGMGLFTLGTEIAMTPMGELIGAHMTKKRNLWLIVIIGFLVGFIITVAEPDLQVLADQVASIDRNVLIWSVAAGVGIFLVVSLLRILFRLPLNIILVICYIGIFILAFLVPNNFVAVAFDSGGVTTGPMTVPFIMALGVGVASVRSDSNAESDSFGLIALCSIGPILAVLLLGLFYGADSASYSAIEIPEFLNTRELWSYFVTAIPEYMKEVIQAVGPIAIFFVIYQLISLHLPRQQLLRITVGIIYTFLGLVLFLTGVNVGFMPAGNYLGQQLASLPYNWIIVPIGALIGYFIVSAEPAVYVLNKQVEDITDGAIPQKTMMLALSVGVAISLALAMIRVLTGISIFWMLIPGYIIAIGLSFFVPKIFTSIAFDSGGVASGPMTATFLLPFAMGACEAIGGDISTDAFGVVAMVAMTPLITIQLVGLYYKLKSRADSTEEAGIIDSEIIDLSDEEE